MAGQEEVVQPDNVAEVGQDVSKPGDQPTESEDGPHLSPKNQSINGTYISAQNCNVCLTLHSRDPVNDMLLKISHNMVLWCK